MTNFSEVNESSTDPSVIVIRPNNRHVSQKSLNRQIKLHTDLLKEQHPFVTAPESSFRNTIILSKDIAK